LEYSHSIFFLIEIYNRLNNYFQAYQTGFTFILKVQSKTGTPFSCTTNDAPEGKKNGVHNRAYRAKYHWFLTVV
jgi:hypothetical protein